MSTKSGHHSSWQYIMEDTPENITSAGVPFRLPGSITGDTPMEVNVNAKTFRALHQPSDTDMRSISAIEASKNEYRWSVAYVPFKRVTTTQYDFRHFFGLALNNTSSTAATGGRTYGTALTTATRTFTIFKEIDNLQHQFNGCRIGRFTMRSSIDNPVECEAEGFASASTFSNLAKTDATSLVDATPFMWSDIRIYIDGTLATNCTAFEFSVNNNVEPSHVLGNRDPQEVLNRGRDVELTITRQYTDIDEYTDAKNNTAKSFTIVLDDATDANIMFRNCKYDTHPIPAAVDGVLTHVLRIKAEHIGLN